MREDFCFDVRMDEAQAAGLIPGAAMRRSFCARGRFLRRNRESVLPEQQADLSSTSWTGTLMGMEIDESHDVIAAGGGHRSWAV